MTIPYEMSIGRTRAIVERQLAAGLLFEDWERELAVVLGLEVPDEPIEELGALWTAQTGATPFPDGEGPFRPHPVWGDRSYGIGHVRSWLRLLDNHGVRPQTMAPAIAWLQGLQRPDGHFAAQEEFERLTRARQPREAAERDARTRAAWRQALGAIAPEAPLWGHSDLEDAFCALDALDALGARAVDTDAAARWLRTRQRPDGAFRALLALDAAGDPYASAVADTMWATRALDLLGEAPADREAAIGWLQRVVVPPAIVPQWQRIEALGLLGAIDRLPPSALDRWDQLSFSEEEGAELVSFEAYAAIRAHRWLVGALT